MTTIMTGRDMRPHITVGVDIGKLHDPSAIAVAELQLKPPYSTSYTVRYIARLPLQTPYPEQAGKITAMVQRLQRERKPKSLTVLVDSTGVGEPIVDLVREALRVTVARVIAVRISAGEDYREDGDRAVVAKSYMVSRMQALLAAERLKLPVTTEAEALRQELLDFRIHVDQDGHDTYGARSGKHDDLVIAASLACLHDPSGAIVYSW